MRIVGEMCRDYRQLFLTDAPMLDLRSPIEFNKGAFSKSINLPLMTDCERRQVGTCYKQEGREAAITLGHQLVSGDVKAKRIAQWLDFIEHNPNGYLYCFRGGLRSQTVQRWLRNIQIDYPLVEGGYKAMRRFLIDETERVVDAMPFYVISGLTGSGKTQLLSSFSDKVDLEGIANHRGSSFGGRLTPQPTQIDFENELAVKLLKQEARGVQKLLLEDESRLIGARAVPLILHRKMSESPLIILRVDKEQRVDSIYQEYVIERTKDYEKHTEKDPVGQLQDYLMTAISKVRKRLGPEGFAETQQLVEEAIHIQRSQNRYDQHKNWIEMILKNYYDPMYEYQLLKKRDRIVFEGNTGQVRDYVLGLER